MTTPRHFKLTHDDRADTISLPPEFALSSDDVIVRKEGDRLIIEPETACNRSINRALLSWLATRQDLPAEDWPDSVARDGLTRPVPL